MLQPKKPVKKSVSTVKEKKNIQDATQMKNMRPTGPTSGRVKPTMGKAKNGKSFPDLNKDGKITKADVLKGRGVIAKKGATIKKAQKGLNVKDTTIKGNPKGYNVSTSPMKTGPYEKRLDTIGSGSLKSVRMLNGKGDVMGQERLGSAGAARLKKTYEREKAYTDERRKYNKEFLESREKTGKAADESMKKSGLLKKKSGGSVKKCKYGCN